MQLKSVLLICLFFMGLIVNAATACPPVSVGDITIGHRWIRPSSGPTTAAYLIITNQNPQPDKLVKVDCDAATTVELHNNIEENGITQMRPVNFIEIGKEPVELKPGGLHIMLMGLKDSFQDKKSLPLTLYFEKAGSVTVEFSIQEPKPAPVPKK